MTLGPKKDAKEAKKKQPKTSKPKRLTPYQEIQQFEQTIRDREDQVGDHRFETTNGGTLIQRIGRHFIDISKVGEGGSYTAFHQSPDAIEIPELSPAARRLRLKLQKEQREISQAARGPVDGNGVSLTDQSGNLGYDPVDLNNSSPWALPTERDYSSPGMAKIADAFKKGLKRAAGIEDTTE